MPAWADAHCAAARRASSSTISMLAFFCVALPREVWQPRRPARRALRRRACSRTTTTTAASARPGFEVRLARDSFVHHWQTRVVQAARRGRVPAHLPREPGPLRATSGAEGADPSRRCSRAAGARRPRTVVFPPSVGWAHRARAAPAPPRARARARRLRGGLRLHQRARRRRHAARDRAAALPLQGPARGARRRCRGRSCGRSATTTTTATPSRADARVVYDWIDDLGGLPLRPAQARRTARAGAARGGPRAHRRPPLHEDALRRAARRAATCRTRSSRAASTASREPNPALADPAFAAIARGRASRSPATTARSPSWFDYALLAATARRRPDWTFVLIGPDHDGSLARSGVLSCANVHCARAAALPGAARLSAPLRRRDDPLRDQRHHARDLAAQALRVLRGAASRSSARRCRSAWRSTWCGSFATPRSSRRRSTRRSPAERDPARGEAAQALAEANTWRARAATSWRRCPRNRAGSTSGDVPAADAVAGSPHAAAGRSRRPECARRRPRARRCRRSCPAPGRT